MACLFSPMEQFEIYYFYLGNFRGAAIFNVIFYLLVAALVIVMITPLLAIANSAEKESTTLVGNWWTVLNESIYHTLLEIATDYIGKTAGLLYFTLIYSISYLVLFANLIGLVPYSSTTTVEIIITLAAALTLLVGVLAVGFISHRLQLLAAFIPAGTPLGLIPLMILLELLAYFTRTLSLGLRLAVNMITGHILAKVCVGFIWVAIYVDSPRIHVLVLALSFSMAALTLFMGLEILIAYLQAYIFTFITSITIKDLYYLFTSMPKSLMILKLSTQLNNGSIITKP